MLWLFFYISIFTKCSKIKKGGKSTFFCPKSTMNLTYLCYGSANIKRYFNVEKCFRWKAKILVEIHKLTDFNNKIFYFLIGSFIFSFEKVYKCLIYNSIPSCSRIISSKVPIAKVFRTCLMKVVHGLIDNFYFCANSLIT